MRSCGESLWLLCLCFHGTQISAWYTVGLSEPLLDETPLRSVRILGDRKEIELLSKGRDEQGRIHKHRLRGASVLEQGMGKMAPFLPAGQLSVDGISTVKDRSSMTSSEESVQVPGFLANPFISYPETQWTTEPTFSLFLPGYFTSWYLILIFKDPSGEKNLGSQQDKLGFPTSSVSQSAMCNWPCSWLEVPWKSGGLGPSLRCDFGQLSHFSVPVLSCGR